MSAPEPRYLELLRKQIVLYQDLAENRSERNDLRDAEARAWDEWRHKLASNKQFEEIWRQAGEAGRCSDLERREQEIKTELDQIRKLLEHLSFAGLDDGRERPVT